MTPNRRFAPRTGFAALHAYTTAAVQPYVASVFLFGSGRLLSMPCLCALSGTEKRVEKHGNPLKSENKLNINCSILIEKQPA